MGIIYLRKPKDKYGIDASAESEGNALKTLKRTRKRHHMILEALAMQDDKRLAPSMSAREKRIASFILNYDASKIPLEIID